VHGRDQGFVDPPWGAPVDVPRILRQIPETGQVAGVFLQPLADGARRCNVTLPSARERYRHFAFYPMREHVQLMVEAAPVLFPNRPLRSVLCKLGRLAPRSLLESTIGKVMLGSAGDVEMVLGAMVKTYPLHIKPSQVELVECRPGSAVVRLSEIHYFLDSHHVGCFEGALRFAGMKQGKVRIRSYSSTAADFLLTWET
jgi:uncharacterized protein (TIGR02265 family)